MKRKRKERSLSDTAQQAKKEKRTDVFEGRLAKRENSAGQNGEDF